MTAGCTTNVQGGEYGNALQAAAYIWNTEAIRLYPVGADAHVQGGEYGNALQAAAMSELRDELPLT